MVSIYEQEKEEILCLLRQRELSHDAIAHKVGVSVTEVNAHALDLLLQRAVLTRAVCQEVREGTTDPYYVRAKTVLGLLEHWLEENEGYSLASYNPVEIATAASDYKKLTQEIQDGQDVCQALSLHGTADTQTEARSDDAYLREALNKYWSKHRHAEPKP